MMRLVKSLGMQTMKIQEAYELHYDLISSADQVQIYEPIMKNESGEVTTYQMLATGYLKDNRLLPVGFDKQNPPSVSSVIGEAMQDPTFTGGSDALDYRVQTNGVSGPFTVQVELLYQSVGYRWAKMYWILNQKKRKRLGGCWSKQETFRH